MASGLILKITLVLQSVEPAILGWIADSKPCRVFPVFAAAAVVQLVRLFLQRLDGIPGHIPSSHWCDDGRQAPHVLSLLLPGAPAEVWLHHLEERGIYASAGSACQAKKKDVSPAVLALGLDHESARRVLRFSFAGESTPEEATAAVAALEALAPTLAKL